MPKIKQLHDETKYRLLPPLDAETYGGLKANIAVNGVQVPVVKDEKGHILDGFARAQDRQGTGLRVPLGHCQGAQLSRRRGARCGAVPRSSPPGLRRQEADHRRGVEGESRQIKPLDRQIVGSSPCDCHQSKK